MSNKKSWSDDLPDLASEEDKPCVWQTRPMLRCPKCNAWPFDLWKAYGLIYYKCAKCGYEQRL